MEKSFVALLAVSAASVIPAYADTNSYEGFYAGAGISSVRQDWDDTSWTPVEIFGGYKHSPLVGGEIRLGGFAGGSDPKLTNYQSIYYRTESSNSVGKTYLLLGYSRAEIGAYGDKFTFDGFSYGVGVGFVLSDNFNLNLEYKVLADAEGSMKEPDGTTTDGLKMKLSSVSATLDYRFDGSGLSLFNGNSSRSSSSSTSSDYGNASKGPYVFGDFVFTMLDISSTDDDVPGISENFNGFSLGLGYKLNDTFAIEAGYRDLGGVSESYGDERESLNFSALILSATASIPISDTFSVYGRLGMSELTIDIDISDGEDSGSVDVSKNKVVYGVGTRYVLNERMGVRLELGKFGDWENLAFTTLSLGIDYSF